MTGSDESLLLDDASRILPKVKSSFARVLTSLPAPIHRARDITRVLGVHQTLAWKIMQIVDCTDPLAAAQFIPGNEGLMIFLNAARKHGAPEAVLDQASGAMDEYRRMISKHAGDRASLELMLGASAAQVRPQTDVTYRKSGFQCSSYIWGVQAKARLKASIFYPDQDAKMMRFAVVAGYVGLRRVRPQIRWTLWRASSGAYDDATHREPVLPYMPIDSAGILPSGVPLLTRFCSQPLAAIERIKLPTGDVEDQWPEGPIGDTAAITCFSGDLLRDPVPRVSDPKNPYAESGLQIRTPVEVLVHDLFVHRDLFGKVNPVPMVYSELHGKPWYETAHSARPEHHLLPFSETAAYLGRGPAVIHTPNVPRYEEMMQDVFGKLGWDAGACDVYRLQMSFPVLATAVVLRFDMPVDSRSGGTL